ncbi:methyl-accepting chemotaxis protein [Roseovarius salis]|uniref:methyl-accepting chemotaxis protein n=1 Tax=Roseovarius salis TaxID=3376063 RepID=UPI0037C98F41
MPNSPARACPPPRDDRPAPTAPVAGDVPPVDVPGSDRLIARLARHAGQLGFEMVDFAGFTEELDRRSAAQLETLGRARDNADAVITANTAILHGVETMRTATGETAELVRGAVKRVQGTAERSGEVAHQMAEMAEQVSDVLTALEHVRKSNRSISDIASQVTMLAINARIEATRAGEAGAGFATIANAINELAVTTSDTARTIQSGVEGLNETLRRLEGGSAAVRDKTGQVIRDNEETDAALTRIAAAMDTLNTQTETVLSEAETVRGATDNFAPAFKDVETSIGDTSKRISDMRERADKLVDHSETMVQDTVGLGAATGDQPFIDRVRADAARISALLEEAVATGRISESALFSREYEPIPGTRPQQMMAPFTRLADALFPPVQEAALDLSDQVIFCAAVNRDGYLPTHNRKFSRPQGPDEEWNTANCRNRRIFDDRVGLKAGRNTQDFLLQVYRRDMGGGTFKLMKDVSAPISVRGRHWGGLRLAYLA